MRPAFSLAAALLTGTVVALPLVKDAIVWGADLPEHAARNYDWNKVRGGAADEAPGNEWKRSLDWNKVEDVATDAAPGNEWKRSLDWNKVGDVATDAAPGNEW